MARAAQVREGILEERVISLKDPISKKRIKCPVVGPKCKHSSCFDRTTFIKASIGERKPLCPICQERCPIEKLVKNNLVEELLQCVPQSVPAVSVTIKWQTSPTPDPEPKPTQGDVKELLGRDSPQTRRPVPEMQIEQGSDKKEKDTQDNQEQGIFQGQETRDNTTTGERRRYYPISPDAGRTVKETTPKPSKPLKKLPSNKGSTSSDPKTPQMGEGEREMRESPGVASISSISNLKGWLSSSWKSFELGMSMMEEQQKKQQGWQRRSLGSSSKDTKNRTPRIKCKCVEIKPDKLSFQANLVTAQMATLDMKNTKRDKAIAFKVRTTKPKRYVVRPTTGVLPPNSSFQLHIIYSPKIQPFQKGDGLDKFLIECLEIPTSVTTCPVEQFACYNPSVQCIRFTAAFFEE